MIYSDRDIEIALSYGAPRGLTIEGLVPGSIQPASVDFHLSDRPLRAWHYEGLVGAASPMTVNGGSSMRRHPDIVPWEDQSAEMHSIRLEEWRDGIKCFRLEPGQFALASTTERVEIGSGMAGRLEGKSSLARLGLVVHTTAGFFDPGFEGYPTLELLNVSPRPMLLRPGMPIAQMAFFRMTSEPRHLYGERGKYDQQGPDPEPSHYHENFTPTGLPAYREEAAASLEEARELDPTSFPLPNWGVVLMCDHAFVPPKRFATRDEAEAFALQNMLNGHALLPCPEGHGNQQLTGAVRECSSNFTFTEEAP
jgi:dCTP deaminase